MILNLFFIVNVESVVPKLSTQCMKKRTERSVPPTKHSTSDFLERRVSKVYEVQEVETKKVYLKCVANTSCFIIVQSIIFCRRGILVVSYVHTLFLGGMLLWKWKTLVKNVFFLFFFNSVCILSFSEIQTSNTPVEVPVLPVSANSCLKHFFFFFLLKDLWLYKLK